MVSSHHVRAYSLEVGSTLSEVMDAYHNVAKWSKPERARWSLNWFAVNPTIRKEPKGVVLIISPFNYPMWLLLGPLVRTRRASATVTFDICRYRQGPSQQAMPACSNLPS
jgi:acyl-CoA reductase-like NAD-dependent aldehyde dehydrogenase